ncbi:HPF/RaiA family ribosome-associated protein [Thiolapillus sp.]
MKFSPRRHRLARDGCRGAFDEPLIIQVLPFPLNWRVATLMSFAFTEKEHRMDIRFSYRKIDKNEKKILRETVGEAAAALQGILGGFDTDVTELEGVVERHANRALYRARLKLHLPGKTLVALEEAGDGNAAIRQAFSELRRQVERFKHLAKNDYLWKRPRRRAELRSKLAGNDDGREQRKAYVALVQPHLPELYHFIRRELAYRQSLGDLSPADIRADEVLDAVVARGFDTFSNRPRHLEILPWLTGMALAILQEEVEAHRIRERRISMEAFAPTDAMDISDDEDTRMYEFYQPDEVIRMEDIIPDPESDDPEQVAAMRERSLLVHGILALLPPMWRQTLVLTDVHGMQESELAEILEQTPEQLQRLRSCAEAFMREWLSQHMAGEELDQLSTARLLGTPLREPLPEELQSEVLKTILPLE